MNEGRVYVVGAGLAGLSACVALTHGGLPVELIEAAPQAGGRCRSYYDTSLGQTIDNGNHLLLSGNHATMAYLRAIGAQDGLLGPQHAHLAFRDLATGARWTIAPDDGPIPFWLFDRKRRVPGTRARDYLVLTRLLAAGKDDTIADVMPCRGILWERLLQPFFLAALNTEPGQGSARLAARLVRETFARGGHAYCARIAHPTLASVFVDPALISWAVDLATATRRPVACGVPQIAPYVSYGASPRGPISVIAGARALAVLRGRDYVLAADVEAVVRDAFRHRLVLSYQALAEEVTADRVLDEVLAAFAPPQIDLGRSATAAA